ncbi:MAG: hypothetical protein PWP38_789 [Clostridiales bacterium]|nr:hypothetical protein [Clostridiales bacterium]
MNIFGILITIGSIAGTVVYFLNEQKSQTEPIDAYGDYEKFLEAATQYREEKEEYAKDIKKLEPYLVQYESLPLRRYALSLDGKFLIINNMPEEEAQRLINEIGGDSYINGAFVYLTLQRKNDISKIRPIAHFNIRPDTKINTMTVLYYDTAGCIAEDNEIVEKKWENRQITFRSPGTYTIKLKIKDKNGNWSEEFSREIRVTEEQGIRSIEGYAGSFFYIFKSGRTLAYGKNEFGQLGIGTLSAVPDLRYNNLYDGVEQAACGENFNIFKMNDGTVCAAGSNRSGELGTGDKNSQRTLNAVWGLENIKQVAAGKRFAAALDLNGNVYVWGDNMDNQIMKDDVKEALMPTRLEGVEGIKQIALGANFGLALKYDGTVMGWGDNSHGQLGIGYKGHLTEPVVTLYKNVAQIAAGEKFSLVVTESGRMFGAGNNAYGQLGMKGKSEVLFPTEIPKLKDIATVYARESLALAITTIGKGYVWGNFNAPGVRPIYEPEELAGIQYIKVACNTGKKCYVIDNKNEMFTISDTGGRYEKRKMYENFSEYREGHRDA